MSTLVLDPRKVKPFNGQPRKRFRGIPALAESIKAVGQVTPIVVTPIASPNGFTHELVDGERRLKACLLIDKRIKAVLDDGEGSESRFALSIAANFCRQEHDAIEISDAIHVLKGEGRTNDQIAAVFGKSPGWVSQFASLAALDPVVREELKREGEEDRQQHKAKRRKGRMTTSLAMALTPLEHKAQRQAARFIMAQGLSITSARNYIQRLALGNAKIVREGSKINAKRSPFAQWTTLQNGLNTFRHVAERYATMKADDLAKVIEAGGPANRGIVANQLEKLCEDLLGLADEMRKER